MSGPVLAVRVAANVEELKRNLQEGVVNQVEVVRSSLTKMANSYDPQVLINKAGLTAAAIQQVGGVAMLSAEQQARANRVLDEGVAAFGRLGQQVPAGLMAMKVALDPAIQSQNMLGEKVTISEAEMRKATGTTSNLTGVYKTFDNVLQAVGINIGSEAKGILQLAENSGKTVSQMGLLSTAALGAGAAFAGWNIGRWIADVLDLDNKIAGLTSRLMGYGDLAAETAGAKQDVINRAIAAGAKETISYAQAITFLAERQKDLDAQYVVSGQRLADTQKSIRGLSEAKRDAIVRAKELGATEEQIHRVYGVSADVIKELVRQKEAASAASEKHKKKLEEETEAAKKRNAEYDVEIAKQRVLFDNLDKEAAAAVALNTKRDAAQGWINAMERSVIATEAARTADRALTEQQGNGLAVIGQAVALHTAAGEAAKTAADRSTQAYQNLGQQVQLTGDAVKELLRTQVYSAKVNAILSENSGFTSQSQRERIAALVPDFGSSARASGGGSQNITVNVTVNGGGSPGEIGRSVRDEILDVFRSGAIPFPSPV